MELSSQDNATAYHQQLEKISSGNFSISELPPNSTSHVDYEIGSWTHYFSQAAAPACAFASGYMVNYAQLDNFDNGENFEYIGVKVFSGLFYFGAMTGAPVAGYFIELVGRKLPMMVVASFLSLVWIYRTFTHPGTHVSNAVMRIFFGLITGAFALILPIYALESSEPSRRGTRCLYYISELTLGTLISTAAYTWVKRPWLRTLLSYLLMAQLIQLFFVGESPQWLKSKENSPSPVLHDLKAALTSGVVWEGTGISIFLMILQQLTVFQTMTVHFPKIVRTVVNSNWRREKPSEIILLALQVVGIGLALLLIDWLGRRPLLLVSIVLVTVTSFLFGLFLLLIKQQEEGEEDGDLQVKCDDGIGGGGGGGSGGRTIMTVAYWLGFFSTVIFFVAFNFGIRPIAFLSMAELLPMKGKGFMAGIIIFINFLVAYIVQVHIEWQDFDSRRVMEHSKKLYLKAWIYAIISGVGIPFIYFLVPEMRGQEFRNFE